MALRREGPFQAVLVLKPLLGVQVIVLEEVAHDVNQAKLAARLELDVHPIVVLWQDVACFSIYVKVNAGYLVVVHVDVLVLVLNHGLESGADPGDEDHGSVFEEYDAVD